MRHQLLAFASLAMLASSQGLAEPVPLFPPEYRQPTAQPLPRHNPDWFFGDGGFSCPMWCDDAGQPDSGPKDLEPQRQPRIDPSDDWFFGDGGFDCPAWQCGRYQR